MPEEQDIKVQIAVIATQVTQLLSEMAEVKAMLASRYVTKAEIEPIKRVVYGGIGVVLVSFVGAVVALVWKG